MGKGHELLHRVHEALNEFEQSVVRREHRKMLDSKVSLQQDVDTARQHVVQTIIQVIKEAQEEYTQTK